MADVEKIKSMTHEERTELFLNYDRLFTEIENLYRSSKGEEHKAYSKVLDVITDIAVDVEPVKREKWEVVRTHNNFIKHMYKCPACEKNQFARSNYCPNCGAKMVGKEV